MVEPYDLRVWKDSLNLCIRIYKSLALCKDRRFKYQVQRLAISIPSIIAEANDRKSSDKEFFRILNIANTLCVELRKKMYHAKELGLINENESKEYIANTKRISEMLLIQIITRKKI